MELYRTVYWRLEDKRLQDECTAHVQQHGNVKEWSFATTGSGNLKCKYVIHTVGGSYMMEQEDRLRR